MMKNYVTIFGEKIKGELHKERENTIIVKDEKGERHVVHKTDAGLTKKRASKFDFDLANVKKYGQRPLPVKFKTPNRNTRYSMV